MRFAILLYHRPIPRALGALQEPCLQRIIKLVIRGESIASRPLPRPRLQLLEVPTLPNQSVTGATMRWRFEMSRGLCLAGEDLLVH